MPSCAKVDQWSWSESASDQDAATVLQLRDSAKSGTSRPRL